MGSGTHVEGQLCWGRDVVVVVIKIQESIIYRHMYTMSHILHIMYYIVHHIPCHMFFLVDSVMQEEIDPNAQCMSHMVQICEIS